MNAIVDPLLVGVGPSLSLKPFRSSAAANSARFSTSKARCIRSGCTCTLGEFGNWQISISSSLSGVRRNTIFAPRGDTLLRATVNSSACS